MEVVDEAQRCEDVEKRPEEPPNRARRRRRAQRRAPAPLRHVMGGVRRWFARKKLVVASEAEP